jgi:uncharacterized membrane protein
LNELDKNVQDGQEYSRTKMSHQPPTLNYQTPLARPRRWPHRLALMLLVLCACIAFLVSWQLQRARQAALRARQAQLMAQLSKKRASAQPGPTTNYFLSIRTGDGDGARPVYVVPIEPDDRGFTRPPDTQKSESSRTPHSY